MIDSYIYVIVALLPLTSLMLLFQVNPYQALVIRAIVGAVAALVYIILGAADVSLTEALVGTMLAVTLYVIAVRSSLVMRLGILQKVEKKRESHVQELIASIRKTINKHHLRLELVEYSDSKALELALMTKEVHAICTTAEPLASDKERLKLVEYSDSNSSTQALITKSELSESDTAQLTDLKIRVHHLFEIMQTELNLPETTLAYFNVSNSEDKH